MTYNPIAHRIANYQYGSPDQLKVVRFKVKGKTRTFIVGIANAYNAFGLIGSEHNGIAVLDEDNRCVVLDQHERNNSGWCEPPANQRNALRSICSMSWSAFKAFCEGHPRFRGVAL
jgi:hypothetical protein